MKTRKTTMKTMKTSIPFLSIIALLFMTSCTDDDAVTIINEEELITTVELELTNSADATNVVLLKSVDIDGEGPDDPVITITGTVNANSTYLGAVRFLNESIAPSEDITEEVIEESNEHEVFYTSSITDLTITKTDVDVNGNPLGVLTTFQTGAIGTGTLILVLRHEPIKPNDNTLIGAGGETDAEVSFTFEVE
ncbi:type 1 periplasmic binding fold superfamily protein [Nonlabens sp. MB-3u-79]|uniref:type 1 periplasmic binding fold superfamily protein n=1 Tax=Nonlabens sp. MB-3u-79 TaxID=2058134 RepID=UPI000C301078|nr:type 1 periplasmic binding fold superfamily protein [Nonlabens sp. MB-3u-79]AUC78034.1 type 1 periplasmic binding fold superfamily protein [Nonlabens sp. MB-3u-79]